LKFAVSFVVVSCDCEETTGFGDLGGCCVIRMYWTGSWINWEGIAISIIDGNVACVLEDEAKETEHGLRILKFREDILQIRKFLSL
jgi:hypothetical protein